MPDAMKAGLRAIQNPSGKSRGRRCRYRSPDKTFSPVSNGGVFIAAGHAFGSCPKPMPLDMQMPLALLQDMLLALRANAPDVFKAWLPLGIEILGEPAFIELMVG